MLDDPRWQEARTHLEILKRQSAAFVIARHLGDPVAASVAAWWGQRTLRLFRALLDDAHVRPDMAPAVDEVIADHLAIFQLSPHTFTVADSARVLRWTNAPPISGQSPHLFELNIANRDAGALDFEGLSLVDSCFDTVALFGSAFERTTVQGCHFWRADLERTTWHGARVERSTFYWCNLVDADLDGATFTDCIFYEANLGATDAAARIDARFINCDLRRTKWKGRATGVARFDRCEFSDQEHPALVSSPRPRGCTEPN